MKKAFVVAIAAVLAAVMVRAWLSGARDLDRGTDGDLWERDVNVSAARDDEEKRVTEEVPVVEVPDRVETGTQKTSQRPRIAPSEETVSESTPSFASKDWPADIENQIWEYFAHQPGLKLTNIMSVDCDARACEMLFTGTDVNPQHVDEFGGLLEGMYELPWNVQQGSIGMREISPGTKAFAIKISNVQFIRENPKSDMARQ